ncbi:MAG: hypothetical protein ING84_05815 [Cytophagales bacterium]|nr:hypothetical protein [Cytophagales bacterium]MCA6365837.1 hypothetical protein [Cytophagales bacterium]MCA6371233.1 hypothetical protein [Cytophagales bacterium]MCA6375000.1 hypothetical protein [Cytophagales bacterium]MCA6382691.1 hypothetical protein [Cytophagales bacterium]
MRIYPILFCEEALFKREKKFEDKVLVDLAQILPLAAKPARRGEESPKRAFSGSTLTKMLCMLRQPLANFATVKFGLNMDGAWIDMTKRKLAVPNDFIRQVFADFSKAEDFEIIPFKEKQS